MKAIPTRNAGAEWTISAMVIADFPTASSLSPTLIPTARAIPAPISSDGRSIIADLTNIWGIISDTGEPIVEEYPKLSVKIEIR